MKCSAVHSVVQKRLYSAVTVEHDGRVVVKCEKRRVARGNSVRRNSCN